MGTPEPNTVFSLQCLKHAQTRALNTGISLDPEQQQQDESEPDIQPKPDQGTPAPKSGPQSKALVDFRIQQLYNRRLFLLEMQQHFRKKSSRGAAEEIASEDGDKLCELEAIQKELDELWVKEEKLKKEGKPSKLRNGQQAVRPSIYKNEIPRGGVYLLPQPQLTPEQGTRPTGPVVPVDSLRRAPAVTQCPSCREVVFTETHSRTSEATWLVCCLCAAMGCVAGCCLIPFFTGRLRHTCHQCPLCQANIHTYKPL